MQTRHISCATRADFADRVATKGCNTGSPGGPRFRSAWEGRDTAAVTDPQDRESERLGPGPPVSEPGVVRERTFRNMATIDLGPLRRRRDFRLLFFGQGFSFFGSMFTFVAVPFQAYDLTGSTLVIGLIAAAELPPILITAFVGGALADAFDRRRLVQIAELGLAGGAALLLINSLLAEPQLWVIFVAAIAMAAFDGIQRPPLDALEPRLVEPDELPAASALGSLRMNVGMIAGPALGGVLIATAGLPATYALDLATFGVSLAMLSLMRAVPPPPGAERPSVKRVVEGIRYAVSRQELIGTYSVDFIAMFFGMPMALFPAYAEEFGGAGVLGILYAAPAIGSLVIALTSGWTAHVHRHGLAVILAAGMWGVAMVGFGLAQSLAVAVVALAVGGGADSISGIFRSVIWNQTIPDELRGRLAGIEQISYSSGPTLGNLEAGVVATLTSVRTSILSGGILCVVGVAVAALALPAFRKYDSREFAPLPARPDVRRRVEVEPRVLGAVGRDPVLRQRGLGAAAQVELREEHPVHGGDAELLGQLGVRLHGVALGDRLVEHAGEVPRLVREHMDRERDVLRPAVAGHFSGLEAGQVGRILARPARRTWRRCRAPALRACPRRSRRRRPRP